MTKLNIFHVAAFVAFTTAGAVGAQALKIYIAKKDEAIKTKQINNLPA